MNGGGVSINIVCFSPRWGLMSSLKEGGEDKEKVTRLAAANCQKSNRMKNGGDGADRQES